MTNKAVDAIRNYKDGKTNYVQLSINISKEIIDLEDQKGLEVDQLPSRVPDDEPRYHVFQFAHTHEGDFLKSTSKLKTYTVFENHRKSRIQYCERREQCLHFECTKVHQKCQKILHFSEFLKKLKLAVKQCYQTGHF